MKKKLFRGLAAALCAAMMAGSAALPAYAAGPSRESVPYADSYASYQWAFLNTGELRLVPSHTAAVDAAIGAITGSPALSADGTVRSLEGIDMNIVPAWKKYDAKSGKRQVIVALIDTGVDITHPELSGSIWTNTGKFRAMALTMTEMVISMTFTAGISMIIMPRYLPGRMTIMVPTRRARSRRREMESERLESAIRRM